MRCERQSLQEAEGAAESQIAAEKVLAEGGQKTHRSFRSGLEVEVGECHFRSESLRLTGHDEGSPVNTTEVLGGSLHAHFRLYMTPQNSCRGDVVQGQESRQAQVYCSRPLVDDLLRPRLERVTMHRNFEHDPVWKRRRSTKQSRASVFAAHHSRTMTLDASELAKHAAWLPPTLTVEALHESVR